MATTATPYGGFLQSLVNKQINLNSDTLNVMLLGSGYTPAAAHRYQTDLGANEITGTGYTAGGQALSSVLATYAAGSDSLGQLTLSAATVQWNASTITNAWYAAIVDVTPGTAATNPLIGYVAFGQAESDTAGVFQIAWNASGIFQLAI